jgi:hypothetical protein
VTETKNSKSRRWGRTEIVLVVVLLAVVAVVGAWVAIGKGARLPEFSMPADHEVSASDSEWLRCAAETIERHPQPLGAQNGFVIELSNGEWLVRGRWADRRVEVDNGDLLYGSPGSADSRRMPLDCPAVSPSGSVETPP